MHRRRGAKASDWVGPLIWLGIVAATIGMAALAIRPIWDPTAWVG